MTDDELEFMEEMRRDMLLEDYNDSIIEIKLRNDFDFALDYFGISEAMTITEFRNALQKLQHYYPDLTVEDLLTWI